MLKVISKIIYGLSLVSAFILYIMLALLNVIPNHYFLALSLIFIVLYLIMAILTWKTKKKWLTIILIIIEVVFGTCFLLASDKVYETNDFLEKINKEEKETKIYYVIVKKESNNQTIKDIAKKTLGTYEGNDIYYQEALKKVNKKVTTKKEKKMTLNILMEDLLTNKTEAILISKFNKEWLKEQNKAFETETKIIASIKISIPNKTEKKNTDITKEPFSILISGIDTSGPINTVSRSDVNIVATINPKTNEILLTSIPRDYYVNLHGITDAKDKLTHAGLYGANMSVATISDLLEIEIEYYIRVNFDTLVNLVDTIGGVDVYSDVAFRTYKGTIKKGMNHLNGEESLAFSRERKYFAEGDRKRGRNQEEVIKAIIQKMTSSKVLLTNYSSILTSLSDTFQTTLPTEQFKKLVKYQIETMPQWNIKTLNLDGIGSEAYTYSIPTQSLYVMIPDEKTVNQARIAIKGIRNNQTLKEIGLE